MIQYTPHASLLPHNTFGLSAEADLLVEYDQEDDLIEIFNDPRIKGRPFMHIGQGSNLLFTQDYSGVILHSRIKGIKISSQTDDEQLIEVGAGERWDDVCRWAADRGLYGIENLSGIPGEAGAAAVQNIGAYGVEFKDVAMAVAVFDVQQGRHYIIGVEECQYGYRTSVFKCPEFVSRFIVTSVLLRLKRKADFNIGYGNIKAALLEKGYTLAQGEKKGLRHKSGGRPITLAAMRETVLGIRTAKLPDPAVYGNAGSFFKNPVITVTKYRALVSQYPDLPKYDVDAGHVKVPAGWLIEHSGCSTRRIGDAAVYPRQCLVLVNMGKAKADEIVQLSKIIVQTIHERFDITIEPEVIFV